MSGRGHEGLGPALAADLVGGGVLCGVSGGLREEPVTGDTEEFDVVEGVGTDALHEICLSSELPGGGDTMRYYMCV